MTGPSCKSNRRVRVGYGRDKGGLLFYAMPVISKNSIVELLNTSEIPKKEFVNKFLKDVFF